MKKLILFLFVLLSFTLYAQNETIYRTKVGDDVKIRKAADFYEGEYGLFPVRVVSQAYATEGETASAINTSLVAGDSSDVYMYGAYEFTFLTILDSVKYNDTLYVEMYGSDRELAGKVALIDQADRTDYEFITSTAATRSYLIYNPFGYGYMVYNTTSDTVNFKIRGQ